MTPHPIDLLHSHRRPCPECMAQQPYCSNCENAGTIPNPDLEPWRLSLIENPRDAATWAEAGDFLENPDEGRQYWEPSSCSSGLEEHVSEKDEDGQAKAPGRGVCSAAASPEVQIPPRAIRLTTPYLCWLTSRLVWLTDERNHGVEPCKGCQQHLTGHHTDWGYVDFLPDGTRRCSHCKGVKTIPTFALLFDRPGEEPCPACKGTSKVRLAYEVGGVLYVPAGTLAKVEAGGESISPLLSHRVVEADIPESLCKPCNGTGRKLVRGHLGELADWMKEMGDPRWEAVGELSVQAYRPAGHGVVAPPYWIIPVVASYPDACREAIRRVMAAVTERCSELSLAPCKNCLGLGWRTIFSDGNSRMGTHLPRSPASTADTPHPPRQ